MERVGKSIRVVLGATLTTLITFALPAHAIECPNGLGIYRGTSETTHELRFTTATSGVLTLSKGKAKAVHSFTLTYSNGLARAYIAVSGKDAPNSVVMEFAPDFTASKTQGSAPFLVTPDLTAGFYHWPEFRSRDQNELLPDSAWRLVGCASNGKPNR